MKKTTHILIAFLIVLWTSFIIWEIQVHKWAQITEGPIIRVDLIFILPILVLTTVYVFYHIKKKKNKL